MKDDTVSRQAAIEYFVTNVGFHDEDGYPIEDSDELRKIWTEYFDEIPSAQPTLYGYNIEHLELIARILQKEDLPPERIVEVLTDIGRIVAIVRDEFVKALRKAVEQCTI